MATAEEIAANKAAQEQEGFSRTPITDSGQREADPHADPLNDRSEPAEIDGPSRNDDDGGQREPQGRKKPINMSPSDEARANIAKRFRRDEEPAVEFNGDANDPAMLYGKHGQKAEPEPEPEPARAEPEPAPQPQEKRYTIKVRGQTLELSESEILERASKVEAADSYLKESRDLLDQARSIRKENRERDPADPHRPEARTNAQDDLSDPDNPADPQHPADELEGAIEEVRYGTDSKEAAEKLRKVIAKEADKAADDRQIQRLIGQDTAKSTKALKAFIDANPDLANDQIASAIMEQQIYAIQREELLKVGIDEAKLPKDSRTLAQWHQFQRIHGSPVSSQDQMLTEAKSRLDSWRGVSRQPNEQRKPSASPRVEVTVDRNARRANLPNQPTRTMTPPQARPPAQPATADRSSVIANMRKSRGQIVA